MGNAAELFHCADSEKETLHRRIAPSEEQQKLQEERWNELADYLGDWLKEATGFTVRTWIQGSYKFGTQIRPARTGEEYDIDLGAYLEWENEPDDEMSANELKHQVHDCLFEYMAEAEGISKIASPPKERCERIHFEDDFHIDVPGYHLDPIHDIRTLATETKGWEHSDPKALVVWFRKMAGDDDERTQLRRIVRYLKMWAALKLDMDCRPSSVLLTVLATEAYLALSEECSDDDDVLLAVIEQIHDRLDNNMKVPNPVDRSENLNRLNAAQREVFLVSLSQLKTIAKNAALAETKLEAGNIWGLAFEHFFPMPDPSEIVKEAAISKALALPTVEPLDIEVTATPQSGTGKIFRSTNSIGPVPKNYDLFFKVLSPPPSDYIYWMARNTGREADEANHLGHHSGMGATTKDSTAYNGIHYMDCSAFSNGRLVGFRRVPVVIHGNPVQRRRFNLKKIKHRKW